MSRELFSFRLTTKSGDDENRYVLTMWTDFYLTYTKFHSRHPSKPCKSKRKFLL